MMDVPHDPPGMGSDAEDELDDEDEDMNMDDRYTVHRRDMMIADEDGYVSDSDGEDELIQRPHRRNRADYRGPGSFVAKGQARMKESDEELEKDAKANSSSKIEQNGVEDEEAEEDDETTGLEIEVEVPEAAKKKPRDQRFRNRRRCR